MDCEALEVQTDDDDDDDGGDDHECSPEVQVAVD